MVNKIQELVFSFLEMVGINIREQEPGIWSAKITESEQGFFNGSETLLFTFDREKAEKHRDLELISEGSFLLRKIIERLSSVPKASRLFSTRTPEVAPSADGSVLRVVSDKLYYRPKVIFNYKVQFECDQRREKLFSISADSADDSIVLEEGLQAIDINEFTEMPQPEIKIEESGIDILRLYLQSCQRLEETISEEICELREWGNEQCRENMKVFSAYLDEQKQELLKKKENVSFHLYFFQKEEEIDKLIDNLEEERRRKISELEDKFSLKVNISLVNSVVIYIPTVGAASVKNRKSTEKLAAVKRISSCTGLEARTAIQ